MEQNNEKKTSLMDRVLDILFIGAGVVGIGVGIYAGHQLRECKKLINAAGKQISAMTEIDVSQSIINNAISVAAARETNRAVSRAVRSANDAIANEAQKQVEAAVKQTYGKINKNVSERIAQEVAKISKDDISETVAERAKELIVEKFEGKLDNMLEEYNRNLENVGKIYQSIASSMTDKATKDIKLSLS